MTDTTRPRSPAPRACSARSTTAPPWNCCSPTARSPEPRSAPSPASPSRPPPSC
ncbi:hypothetical protein ACFQ1I_31180 [Kitasatospora arboriphila]